MNENFIHTVMCVVHPDWVFDPPLPIRSWPH
jgi:hypothetical protein